jgi:hypothetical protein
MAQMNWYTTLRNAINKISLDKSLIHSIIVGEDALCCWLKETAVEHRLKKQKPCVFGLDGYLGAEWSMIVSKAVTSLEKDGFKVITDRYNCDLYKPREFIDN